MGKDLAREAEEADGRRLRAVGQAIRVLQRACDEGLPGSATPYGITVKLDADFGTSVLIVVKAWADDAKVVAFVGGPDLETALLALAKKAQANALKWRPDQYA